MTGGGRALVRASTRGEPSDLYLVEARLSPEGVLLDTGTAHSAIIRNAEAVKADLIVVGAEGAPGVARAVLSEPWVCPM